MQHIPGAQALGTLRGAREEALGCAFVLCFELYLAPVQVSPCGPILCRAQVLAAVPSGQEFSGLPLV